MQLPGLISDLAIILGVAGLSIVLFRLMRLPVTLGYLVAGIVMNPTVGILPVVTDVSSIQVLSELGVIFILFSLGLEFSFRRVLSLDLGILFIGIAEVVGVAVVGIAVVALFGIEGRTAWFLGAMVAISSTTMIMKNIEDFGFKGLRFTQTIFGILIVEDIVAVVLLFTLSALSVKEGLVGRELVESIAKMALLLPVWVLGGLVIVPIVMNRIRSRLTDEALLMASVGFCLLLVFVWVKLGHSAALASFVTGAILSETSEHRRIERVIHPIRDLFGAIFFVCVSLMIDFKALQGEIGLVFGLMLVAVLGKSFFSAIACGFTGRSLRESIQTGLGLTQIGEFSWIIAAVGLASGVLEPKHFSVVAAAAVGSAFLSPVLLRYSRFIADQVERLIPRKLRRTLAGSNEWQVRSKKKQLRRLRAIGFWILNLTLVAGIFRMVSLGLLPQMPVLPLEPQQITALAFITSIFLSSPFLWAMWSIGSRVWTRFLNRVLALSALGVLSTEFFHWGIGLTLGGFLVTLFVTRFYSQLESTHGWMVDQLKGTLKGSREDSFWGGRLVGMAPWDSHLAEFTVNVNSEIVGRTLKDANLRGLTGATVVLIARGSRVMIPPQPTDRFFPLDQVIAAGRDEDLVKFRNVTEPSGVVSDSALDIETEIQLTSLKVSDDSDAVERSLSQIQVRERYRVLVIGLERDGGRIQNPGSSTVLRAGDVLWVVGRRQDIEVLYELVSSGETSGTI